MNKIFFSKEQILECYDSNTFYAAIGMIQLFENKTIKNVFQMKINSYTFNEISKILTKNWKKCKCVKHLYASRAKQAIEFDWCNYSPVIDDSVDNWCISYDI